MARSTDPSQGVSAVAADGVAVSADDVARVLDAAGPADRFRDKRVLVIVPDGTRTAPVGLVFHGLYDRIGTIARRLDVMVALGTHQPMSEEAICARLGMSLDERHGRFREVAFINHEWNNPQALTQVGTITRDDVHALTDGRFAIDVPIEVNRRLFDYDELVIIGPVFPHEVVGFSGGNKYLFPGVSGPAILNFFHWLGAVVTNPMIIGSKWTPVRKVVDAAGAMVPVPKTCICLVVRPDTTLAGIFAGTPEAAVIPELAGYPGEVIPKKRYSAFYNTPLEARLKNLRPKKLVICGVLTNICVLHTTADARNRDYEVEIPVNCVASPDEAAYRSALEHMEKVLGAKLTE